MDEWELDGQGQGTVFSNASSRLTCECTSARYPDTQLPANLKDGIDFPYA